MKACYDTHMEGITYRKESRKVNGVNGHRLTGSKYLRWNVLAEQILKKERKKKSKAHDKGIGKRTSLATGEFPSSLSYVKARRMCLNSSSASLNEGGRGQQILFLNNHFPCATLFRFFFLKKQQQKLREIRRSQIKYRICIKSNGRGREKKTKKRSRGRERGGDREKDRTLNRCHCPVACKWLHFGPTGGLIERVVTGKCRCVSFSFALF